MYSIGIDIGGMSIKFGLVSGDGKILTKTVQKTPFNTADGVNAIISGIKELMQKADVKREEIKGIGIGCPGAVDSKEGIIDVLPNLGWESIAISKILKKEFDLPVKISNDANVATLAEVKYGSAKQYNTAVMFTLGTGVGGGIVIDGKLFEGGWSRGAELGHVTLYNDGIECTCGRRGCIERYVSATALIERTKTAMIGDKNSAMWDYVLGDIGKVDGRTAFECEKTGDKTAKEVVDAYVKDLGESIMNMLNIFRPEAFILGGGVSAQGKNLTDRLVKYCEKFEYGYHNSPVTKIITATLGNDAGIIGAAALIE
ncbi:MAG: ROK family protein [Clostridia bacterium]|nr:ROK family protein [Clostridia bacterium]